MGKRGPQPKGEYGRTIGRTAVLSTRLQPDTRKRLSAAAEANRRSLSQELEHRLRRSFTEDDKVVDFFGSPANAAIVKLLGAVIQSTCTSWLRKDPEDGWVPDFKKDPGEWLRDPLLFDGVLTAVVHALMWFRPPGGRDDQRFFYSSVVEQIISEIQSANPSLLMPRRSKRQHAMALLKDQLAGLASRRHPYDDFFKKEPEATAPTPPKKKHR